MLREAHFRSHCGAKKVDAGVLVLRGEVGSQVAGAVGRRVESGQVSDGRNRCQAERQPAV